MNRSPPAGKGSASFWDRAPLHRQQYRTAPLDRRAYTLDKAQDSQDDRAPDADLRTGRDERHQEGEWYFFFRYSTVTGLVFAKLYFPGCDPLVGTLQAFGIYAVGFVARPVGAAIFGHLQSIIRAVLGQGTL